MYTHTTAAMISHTWFDSDFWYAPEAPVKCSAIDSGSPSAVAAARTACTAAPNDTPGAVSKPTVAAGYCDTRSTCSGDGCSTTCAKLASGVVVPLLVSSSLLFYIGMAFAYFVVFPLAFGFLANTAPEGVQVSTDIASYLSFVMALFMAFGVSFEVPVAIVLLCWMGITSPEDLRKKRPYVLVGAFVVGMLLTPPDVFSQTLLAIPMYCLFEIGVFFSRFYVGKGRNREEENDAEAESEKTEE